MTKSPLSGMKNQDLILLTEGKQGVSAVLWLMPIDSLWRWSLQKQTRITLNWLQIPLMRFRQEHTGENFRLNVGNSNEAG